MAKAKKEVIKDAATRDKLIAPLKVEKDLQEFVAKYRFDTPTKKAIRKKLVDTYTDDLINKYLPIKTRQKKEKPTITYSSIRKDILILAGTVTPEEKKELEEKIDDIEIYIKSKAKAAALRAEAKEAREIEKEAAIRAEAKEKALAELLKNAPAPKKEQKKK